MAYTLEVGAYTFDMLADHAYFNPEINYVITGNGAIMSIHEVRHLECVMTAADSDALWTEWASFQASMRAGEVDVVLKDGGVAKDSLLESAQERGPNVMNIAPKKTKGGFSGIIEFTMDIECWRGVKNGMSVISFETSKSTETKDGMEQITIEATAEGSGGRDMVKSVRPTDPTLRITELIFEDVINHRYRAVYSTVQPSGSGGGVGPGAVDVVAVEQATVSGGGIPKVPVQRTEGLGPLVFDGRRTPIIIEISGEATYYNRRPGYRELPSLAKSREKYPSLSDETQWMLAGEIKNAQNKVLSWKVSYRQQFVYGDKKDVVFVIATGVQVFGAPPKP